MKTQMIPGSKPAACSPCWIRRRAAPSGFSSSSTTGRCSPRLERCSLVPAAGTALGWRRLPRAPAADSNDSAQPHRRTVGVLVGGVGRTPGRA